EALPKLSFEVWKLQTAHGSEGCEVGQHGHLALQSRGHALIWKMISVLGPDGKPLSAKVDVDEGERSWFIEPAKPWAAGEHFLKIDGTLEDLAGNTPQRVFDNDLTLPQGKPGADSISFSPKP
ncbi:MAG: hypothetical protein AAF585_16040, partial [Verrucomicrobiota bacterium]